MARFIAVVFTMTLGFGCAGEEHISKRSSYKKSGDQTIDRTTVQSDTGQIGPVPTGLVGGIWETGACDAIYREGEVRTTDSQLNVNGMGEMAVAVATEAQLDLQIDFSLCEPNYYARAIVFVVDTSESMRSTYNLGNDPISGGTCGRLEAISNFLNALPEETPVNVGFVTFSTGVDKDSGGLMPAAEFKTRYLNTTSLCHTRLGTSGFDTNYTAGLGRAEDMLGAYKGHKASQEVYLITDGLPASVDTDGRAEAARLRTEGIVGTLLLGSNDGFLKAYISSKRPNGDPIHALAGNAGALSAALADTISSRINGGNFAYKTDEVDNWVDFPLDPELTFFHANGILRSDYTGPLSIRIEDIDENGVERRREATLEIIRRDP